MRVYCSVKAVWAVVVATAVTSTPLTSSSNSDNTQVTAPDPRFVVLGIDGKVVPDADPGLYLPKKLPNVFVEQSGELYAFSIHPELRRVERFAAGERRGLSVQQQPQQPQQPQLESKRHGEYLAQAVAPTAQEQDEDDFSGPIDIHLDVQPLEFTSSFFLDSEMPAVQGSIVFAELSCFFVAFIGYLVHSIRLWGGFSRGRKCCLSVVFSSAALYQAAVVAWYAGLLSSDVILGLSSLITRMISLGMVPITTTSFMGRARELCHEQHTGTSPSSSAGSSSRSSRRHRNHQRARYC